jgi:succinoglycan biosynthesis protein ExoA
MPEVSVLVPVLNGMRHLEESTRAMAAQRGPSCIEFLMIDGGSTDGSREFLERLTRGDPRFRLLDNPGRTTPRALNIGLAAARGEFIARMDAHTCYPEDYLMRGLERLRRGDVEHVSGPPVPVGTDTWSRRIGVALRTSLGTGRADFRDVRRERAVFSGFAGVWHADRLRALGGWDEGWPVNQDVELAARLRAAGGRAVSVPAMAAYYRPQHSLAALARQYARYGYYRAKSAVHHPASRRPAHTLCPAVVIGTVAAVAPGPWRRPARAGLVAYSTAVAITSMRVSLPAADRLALPPVFVTMHFAWGAGYLSGWTRYGWRR